MNPSKHLFTQAPVANSLPCLSVYLRACVITGLLTLLAGCQLADMVKFSYANANAVARWQTAAGTTTVPFRLIDSHIVLPVSLNGSEPLQFVLDSGAAANVIFESEATRSLTLQRAGQLPVSGVGTGPDPMADIIAGADLSIGELTLQGLSLIYLPLDAVPLFENIDEVYFDGVIGAPFFSRFLVAVDFDKQLLTFSDPATGMPEPGDAGAEWQSIPIEIHSGTPYLTTKLTTGQGQTATVKLLVDTGARLTASINLETDDDLPDPIRFYTTVSQGLSGDVTSKVEISQSLWLGEHEFTQLPMLYTSAGGESEAGSNGIVGNEVLRRFNLVFDYPGEQLWFVPNEAYSSAMTADRSGLLIRPHQSGAVIKRVAAGSAAAAQGMKAGDIVTRYQDKPLTPTDLNSLKRALASASEPVPLCWLAEGESYCGELKLASRFEQ